MGEKNLNIARAARKKMDNRILSLPWILHSLQRWIKAWLLPSIRGEEGRRVSQDIAMPGAPVSHRGMCQLEEFDSS